MIDRIFEFIEYKGISISEFSKKIDVSNGYLAKQKSNNANIGSHILEKIVRNFPEINIHWLVTGEGQMLVSTNERSSLIENNKKFIDSYMFGMIGNYDLRQIYYYEYYNESQLKKIKESSIRKLEDVYNSVKKLTNVMHYFKVEDTYLKNKFPIMPNFEDYLKEINEEIHELICDAGKLTDNRLKQILYILYYEENRNHWISILEKMIDYFNQEKQILATNINK